MVDASAGKNEQEDTCTAHSGVGLSPENLNHKDVQQSGNRNIESGLSNQPQYYRLNDLQQCPLRVYTDHKKQDKKEQTDAGGNGTHRQPAAFIF